MKVFLLIMFFLLFVFLSYAQAQVKIFCTGGGPYSSLSSITVFGNISENGNPIKDAIINITIKKEKLIKAIVQTNSTSDGIFFSKFSNLDVGQYNVEIVATYLGDQYFCNTNFTILTAEPEIGCKYFDLNIKGRAFDQKGKPLSFGIVFASILDTIYSNSTQFSGKDFEISLRACLFVGNTYILSLTIQDGKGNLGSSQVIFSPS